MDSKSTDALRKIARSVYTMETPGVWISAGGNDIWILVGADNVSISIWNGEDLMKDAILTPTIKTDMAQ